jgi:hypothetical protein
MIYRYQDEILGCYQVRDNSKPHRSFTDMSDAKYKCMYPKKKPI